MKTDHLLALTALLVCLPGCGGGGGTGAGTGGGSGSGGSNSGGSSNGGGVAASPVTLSLWSSADVVSSGQSVSITWSSTASSCTGSGAWSGTLPSGGTLKFTVTQSEVFSLDCGGGTSTASASVRVQVIGTSSPPTSTVAYSASGLTSLSYLILPITGKAQVYDPVNGVIDTVTEAGSTTYPQSLVSIDPTSGQVIASVALNSDPWAMAVSADGQYVYVLFSAEGSAVQRYKAAGLIPDLSIPLASTEYPLGVAVCPTSPTTIAVTGTMTGSPPPGSELQVFDGATPRPNSYLAQATLLSPVWTPDGTGIVVPGNGINVFSVDSQGVALTEVAPAGGTIEGRLHGNVFYDDQGNVISLDGPITQLGEMADYEPAMLSQRVENMAIDKSFTLDFDAFENAYLTSYSATQYYAIDSIRVLLSSGLSGPAGGNVILWGSNGIAWSEGTELVIAHGSFAEQGGSLAPPDSLLAIAGGALMSQAGTQVSYAVYDAYANDLAADSCGNLYAAISGHATYFPNSIVSFDAMSGAITASGFATSEPSVIAVSDDCTEIYAGTNASNSIARLSLPGLTPAAPIPLVQSPPPTSGYLTALPFADSLAVAPGAAGTIAATLNLHTGALCNSTDYGLAIFDGTTRRSDVFTGPYSGPKAVVWGKDASMLYEEDWDGVKSLTVDATGASQPTLLIPYAQLEGDTDVYDLSTNLHFDGVKSRLLTGDGGVYDTVSAAALPILPVAPAINGNGCDLWGAVTTNPQSGKVFYAQWDDNNDITVFSFDSDTLQRIDQVTIPLPGSLTSMGGPIRLVHLSHANTVALTTEDGYVVALSGSMFGP